MLVLTSIDRFQVFLVTDALRYAAIANYCNPLDLRLDRYFRIMPLFEKVIQPYVNYCPKYPCESTTDGVGKLRHSHVDRYDRSVERNPLFKCQYHTIA